MPSNMLPMLPAERPRYDLASAMLQDAMTPRPIGSHLEGLGQLAKAFSGAYHQNRIAGDAQTRSSDLARLIAGSPEPWNDPAIVEQMGGLFGPEASMGMRLQAAQLGMPDEPDTEVGQLLAEMQALPEGDPRRQWYEQRLGVVTTRAPGNSVTVNMPPMERAFDQAYGGAQGQMLAEMVTQANGAAQALVLTDQMESILGMTAQGAFEPARAELASWAQGIGMDPSALGLDGPANAQTLAAAVAQMTLAQAEAMSGVLSDRDMAFLQQSVPQLGNDPQANAQILANMRERLNATIARAQDAERYAAQNSTLMGWTGAIQGGNNQQQPAPPAAPGMIPPPPPPEAVPMSQGPTATIPGASGMETYPEAPPVEMMLTEEAVRAMPLANLTQIPPEAMLELDDGALEYLLAPGIMQFLTDEQVQALWSALE